MKKKLESMFELSAFVNDKFDMQLCIVCAEDVNKNGSRENGPKGKLTCSYWCYRTARDFQIKLLQMKKPHPNFVNYCIHLLKLGIPISKINAIYKQEKKRKFIGPYKID